MIHVSILILADALICSIDAPRGMFLEVNRHLGERGEEPAFKAELVGLTAKTLVSGKYTIHSEALNRDIKKTDVIIIPARAGSLPLRRRGEWEAWIEAQKRKGVEIMVLRGEQGHYLVSTYPGKGWLPEASRLKGDSVRNYPFCFLVPVLNWIEKHCGIAMARHLSTIYAPDFRGYSEADSVLQKKHGDLAIANAQAFIEGHYNYKITIAQLAAVAELGRRSLERRFLKATGLSVAKYIQQVRIEWVKKSLREEKRSLDELMKSVGYQDTKSFRGVFRKVTGMSLADYREKHAPH